MMNQEELKENNQQEKSLDIYKLQYLIETGLPCLQKQHEKAILVIGNTGSGKSTLINLLIGKILKPFHDNQLNQSRIILDQSEKEGATIGNTTVSETTVPNHYYDKQNDIVYIDCPGFGDNKGAEQDISNAVFIQQLFSITRELKILLVAPFSQFNLDNSRGNQILQFVEQLSLMFPNSEILKESLGLIVTKCDLKPVLKNKQFTLEGIPPQQIKNILNTLKIDHQKNKESQYFKEANSNFSKIYDLISNEDKIGIFDRPLEGDEDSIQLPEKILKIIENLKFVQLSNVKPPLSSDSKNKIFGFFQTMAKYCDEQINNLKQKVNDFIQNKQIESTHKCFIIVQELIELKQDKAFNFDHISLALNKNEPDNVFYIYNFKMQQLCSLVNFKIENNLEKVFSFLDTQKRNEKIQSLSSEEKQEILNRNPFSFIIKAIAFVSKLQQPNGDLSIYTLKNFDQIVNSVSQQFNQLQNDLCKKIEKLLKDFQTEAKIQIDSAGIEKLSILESTKDQLQQNNNEITQWIDIVEKNFGSQQIQNQQQQLKQLMSQYQQYFQSDFKSFHDVTYTFNINLHNHIGKLQYDQIKKINAENEQRLKQEKENQQKIAKQNQDAVQKLLDEAKTEMERFKAEQQKKLIEQENQERIRKANEAIENEKKRQKEEEEKKKKEEQEKQDQLKQQQEFTIIYLEKALPSEQNECVKDFNQQFAKLVKSNSYHQFIGIKIFLNEILKSFNHDFSKFTECQKPFAVFATDEIRIDCNINFPSGNVILVAPKIICQNNQIINLSGKDGQNGTYSGSNGTWNSKQGGGSHGANGDCGTSGYYGGIITMIAAEFESFNQNLKIYVNGGRGGDGKDGGDGGSCNEWYVDHPINKNGGDGGNGGYGGEGGDQGEIRLWLNKDKIKPSTILNEFKQNNGPQGGKGKGGARGKPWIGGYLYDSGIGGSEGRNGIICSNITRPEYSFMNDINIQKEYLGFLDFKKYDFVKNISKSYNRNQLMQGDPSYLKITGVTGLYNKYDFLNIFQ